MICVAYMSNYDMYDIYDIYDTNPIGDMCDIYGI